MHQARIAKSDRASVDDWPLVVLKEVMDNALDACEEAEIAPVISIAVTPGLITIRDNGGGMETDTIKSILDYSIRVSSREAYVSPTRGAQGNALKTILAMGYVLDREREDADGINNEAVGATSSRPVASSIASSSGPIMSLMAPPFPSPPLTPSPSSAELKLPPLRNRARLLRAPRFRPRA